MNSRTRSTSNRQQVKLDRLHINGPSCMEIIRAQHMFLLCRDVWLPTICRYTLHRAFNQSSFSPTVHRRLGTIPLCSLAPKPGATDIVVSWCLLIAAKVGVQ